MAEVQIGHAFTSAKADSTDTTIVSSSEWNANDIFKNGTNGQIPKRDTAESTGARWTEGTRSVQTSGNAGAVVTSLPIAANVITFTTNCKLILSIYCVCTTSAGQIVTLTLRRDTVTLASTNWLGTSVGGVAFQNVYDEVPSTHTYDIVCSVSSGTITNVIVSLTAVIIGV